jgi:hypothetical protein
MAPPDQADTVMIFFVWEEAAQMQVWLSSAAYQRVAARVAPFWRAETTQTDYTLFFDQCACSHHFNSDIVEEAAVGPSANSND